MHQIQLEIAYIHFAARIRVVFGIGFLHGHIGQVHVRIPNVTRVHRKPRRRETRKTRPGQENRHGIVRGDEAVDAQVKLFPANEQGIGDVFLNDVLLGRVFLFAVRVLPLTDLIEFGEQKDTLALRFCYGFHDPRVTAALERLDENLDDEICCWYDIKSSTKDNTRETNNEF